MRTKAVLSYLLAAIMFAATVLMVSPAKVDARAGHEHSSAQAIDSHEHHAGHEFSHARHNDEPGHQHRNDSPAAPCTSICCAAGMSCCAALIAVPFDVRLFYERIRLHGVFGEVLTGIEPPVPLRPPRAAA